RPQRLQVRDQQLVAHNRRGAEHLGAAHRDARTVLVDDPGDEVLLLLAPGLPAIGLRVDDHVAQIEVVPPHVTEIIEQGLGASLAVPAEYLDTDDLAQEAGGDMVRRAAEKSAAEFGPFAHRSAPLDQLLIIARHQPVTVDPCVTVAAGALGREGQALQIFRSRLKIVQRGRGPHRVAQGGVRRDVGDALAIDINGPPVAQRAEMVLASLADVHRDASLDLLASWLYSRGRQPDALAHDMSRRMANDSEIEIGRASCRERVEIEGVAGSVKEKKNEDR